MLSQVQDSRVERESKTSAKAEHGDWCNPILSLAGVFLPSPRLMAPLPRAVNRPERPPTVSPLPRGSGPAPGSTSASRAPPPGISALSAPPRPLVALRTRGGHIGSGPSDAGGGFLPRSDTVPVYLDFRVSSGESVPRGTARAWPPSLRRELWAQGRAGPGLPPRDDGAPVLVTGWSLRAAVGPCAEPARGAGRGAGGRH